MTALKKMLGKSHIKKIKYGQMSGYFKGHNDVHTNADKWGVSTSDMQQMGAWDDFLKDMESSVDSWAKDVLPENVKTQIDAQLKKEADKAVASATQQATQKARELLTQQASKPETQNKAIASTVQAGAQAVTKTAQDVADAMRTGGIKAVYEKYPIPFYAAGGLVGLLVLKWGLGQIGAGKVKAVMTKSNPRKRKAKTKKNTKRRVRK